MHELNKLDTLAQMEIIEPLSNLTPNSLKKPREPLGSFTRGGKRLYRLRADNYRLYFEVTADDTLHVQYMLHSNSWNDFLMRNKLPISEEQLVEKDSKFWKYLEENHQKK